MSWFNQNSSMNHRTILVTKAVDKYSTHLLLFNGFLIEQFFKKYTSNKLYIYSTFINRIQNYILVGGHC